MQRHEGGYYIRLLAVDKPGTAATIAKRLAQQNISLEIDRAAPARRTAPWRRCSRAAGSRCR